MDSFQKFTYDFSSPNFHQSGSYHGLPLQIENNSTVYRVTNLKKVMNKNSDII